mgnify:CR=1 FL=1
MQWVIEVIVNVLSYMVVDLFGCYTWPWWTLAALFALAAVYWTSWPLAAAAAIVSGMRLVFAWLEAQARVTLVDRPPPDR